MLFLLAIMLSVILRLTDSDYRLVSSNSFYSYSCLTGSFQLTYPLFMTQVEIRIGKNSGVNCFSDRQSSIYGGVNVTH